MTCQYVRTTGEGSSYCSLNGPTFAEDKNWVVVELHEGGGYDCEEAWITHMEIGQVYGLFTKEEAEAVAIEKDRADHYSSYEAREVQRT